MKKDDINICKVYLKEANVGQNIRAGLSTLKQGLQNTVTGVGQAFNDQKTQTVLSDLVDKIVKDIKPINPNVNKTAVANALKTVVAANPAQAGGNAGGSGKRPTQAFASNQSSTTSNPPASTGGSTNPPASTGTSNPPASTGASNPPASTEEKPVEIPEGFMIDGKDPDTGEAVKFRYDGGSWGELKLSTAKNAKPGQYQNAAEPIEDQELQKQITDAWVKKNPAKTPKKRSINFESFTDFWILNLP